MVESKVLIRLAPSLFRKSKYLSNQHRTLMNRSSGQSSSLSKRKTYRFQLTASLEPLLLFCRLNIETKNSVALQQAKRTFTVYGLLLSGLALRTVIKLS